MSDPDTMTDEKLSELLNERRFVKDGEPITVEGLHAAMIRTKPMSKPYEEMTRDERAACHGRQAVGGYVSAPEYQQLIVRIQEAVEYAYRAGHDDGVLAACDLIYGANYDECQETLRRMEDQPDGQDH
jgi:hypothetical protein